MARAWRYFDASALADRLADSAHAFEESSAAEGAGHAPMPPVGNPEPALIRHRRRKPNSYADGSPSARRV